MISKNLNLPKYDPKHIHSKYWLKYIPNNTLQNNDTIYAMHLASVQRGISNMVNSLGRNTKKMKVAFDTKPSDTTAPSNDSNDITLHNPQTPQEIDLSVGMALHESSHFLLSNGDSGHPEAVSFYLLTKSFLNGNPKLNFGIRKDVEKLGIGLGLDAQRTFTYLAIIANFMEDVRVNDWVLGTSYGYREYYSAMFEMLWHTKEVTTILNSAEAHQPTVENYIGHILNMFNPGKIPVTLPEFDKIVDILDLDNVSKYGRDWNNPWTTYDNLPLLWRNANDILEIIYRNSKTEGGSDEVSEVVDSLIEKTMGDIKEKKYIEDKGMVNNIQQAADCNGEVVMETTQDMYGDGDDEFPIMVFDNFNQAYIDAGSPFTLPAYNPDSSRAVEDGVRMGNLLAHKIRMFQDESIEETLRQPKGKIDKRLLSSIAHGDVKIFKETYIAKNKPVHVHISVDASSSMRGDKKWSNALMLCVALAKVADKVRNFDVTISMRSTSAISVDSNDSSYDVAAIGYVYDSRKDNFSKIVNLFPYLAPLGSTPEGILFENIIKRLAPINNSNEVIFINLSDGQPSMHMYINGKNDKSYSGMMACNHTKKKVSKMKRLGMHVLSYFISAKQKSNYAGYIDNSKNNFEEMYGNSSAFINPEEVGAVARSVNKFVLKIGNTK